MPMESAGAAVCFDDSNAPSPGDAAELVRWLCRPGLAQSLHRGSHQEVQYMSLCLRMGALQLHIC